MACFVPFKEDKKCSGITPHLYGTNGVRYTMVQGYSPAKEFYSPDYKDKPLPDKPDYRRTLYWNPCLKTDSVGRAVVEFCNNSQATSIICSVCGLNNDIIITGEDNY